MSVMSNFTLRSLAKNRVRTIVSVIGIALSCALITAIFTTLTSLNAGLYQRTLESEGSWQIYASNVSDDSLAALEQNNDVADLATSYELGSAAFSEHEQELFGGYLTVKTAPFAAKGSFDAGGAPLTLVPAVTEGRAAETPDEIVLPSMLQGETLGETNTEKGSNPGDEPFDAQDENASGPSGVQGKNIQIGSTVTLDLGERVRADAESGEDMRLDCSTSYTSPDDAQKIGIPEERLVHTQSRTFTVVGFYSDLGSFYGNDFVATGAGLIGITAPATDAQAAASGTQEANASNGTGAAGATAIKSGPTPIVSAYLATQNLSSRADLEALAANAGLGNDPLLHTNLLRYQGMPEDRAVFDSLFVIAATLAVVVAAAGVSLIYNSFSISVAERTRQFGMLSSIGASKRQLRRSVLFEALALGIIGIPVGIALGVVGVAVTLHFTSDALGSAIALEGGIPFTVSPAALVGCALFSLVILLVSAWIPALRASRVSAVDAIRQTQDVRLTRRALRRQRKEVNEVRSLAQQQGMQAAYAGAGSFALHRGIAGRLFGLPGVLAKRSRERASSRGRVVVASLAMSVLLLIVCGSVKLYMDPFVGQAKATNGSGNDADILATFSYNGSPTWSLTPEAFDSYLSSMDNFKQEAAKVEGTELAGVVKQGEAQGFVPASMLDPEAREVYDSKFDTTSANWVPSAYTKAGDYVQNLTTFYLDDATFDALAERVGVDPAQFDDAEHPKALGLDAYRGQSEDGRYLDMRAISNTGTVTLYDLIDDNPDDTWNTWGLVEGQDGELETLYLNTETGETEARELPADTPTLQVDVVGTVSEEQIPSSMYSINALAHYPVLIMPESVSDASAANGLQRMLGFTFANVLFNANDHATATQALRKIAAQKQGEDIRIDVFDSAASGENMRMLAQAIQLFVLLFSLITALVAVANVFNTLTNSIILRTREFAVLKSVGMGKRDFAKMLVCECAGFAVKGFLIGFVLAATVTYVIYYGSSFSFSSLAFTMPWAYVAAAFAVTLTILGISVAFALRKAQAGSIVDALRAEAL